MKPHWDKKDEWVGRAAIAYEATGESLGVIVAVYKTVALVRIQLPDGSFKEVREWEFHPMEH